MRYKNWLLAGAVLPLLIVASQDASARPCRSPNDDPVKMECTPIKAPAPGAARQPAVPNPAAQVKQQAAQQAAAQRAAQAQAQQQNAAQAQQLKLQMQQKTLQAQQQKAAQAQQLKQQQAQAAQQKAAQAQQLKQQMQQKTLQAQQQKAAQAQQLKLQQQQAAQQKAAQAQQLKLQMQQTMQQKQQQAQQLKLQQQQKLQEAQQLKLQQAQQLKLQQQQAAEMKRQQQLQLQQQKLQGKPGAPGLLQQQQLGVQNPGLQQQIRAPGVGQPPLGIQTPGQFQQMPPQQVKRGGNGIGPAGAAAIGVGVGLVGGYVLSNQVRGVTEVQSRRTQYIDGGVTYVQEPGRVIVREAGGPAYIRRNETASFALLGYQSRQEQVGGQYRTIYDRPDGTRIITVTDADGRLIRRIRRYGDGREVVIIDNSFRPRPSRLVEQVVLMPPPPMTIPRERYIVDADRADETTIYETLSAPPLAPIKRRYTLDEVRYSPDLRNQMRSVDINTITFDTGSWEISSTQYNRLATIAAAINRAVQANPQEVFLIEGHTDAVGDQNDNLSLSDRRAEAVSEVLSKNFNVQAENLTTQGYGEQQLRVATDGAARENRRVTVRRITPLLGDASQAPSPEQPQAAPAQ